MPSSATLLENALSNAIYLIQKENLSIGGAVFRTFKELRACIDKSAILRKMKKMKEGLEISSKRPVCPPVLTLEQEKGLAETCRHFSIRDVPLYREEVAELLKSSYGSTC